ncbi:hypothetical protein QBC46DRAFT_352972 [Diplogelasinospora grovesii]|uniref:Uncharacterized protein n=1 Tax=Diplogelasinospora grovesii TaxID=303347 RepID=A0AAN6NBH5_9PEZI|nr:hypothetical protein QBC46DRAFT_352972 [Diplogelasinospora grovesii]
MFTAKRGGSRGSKRKADSDHASTPGHKRASRSQSIAPATGPEATPSQVPSDNAASAAASVPGLTSFPPLGEVAATAAATTTTATTATMASTSTAGTSSKEITAAAVAHIDTVLRAARPTPSSPATPAMTVAPPSTPVAPATAVRKTTIKVIKSKEVNLAPPVEDGGGTRQPHKDPLAGIADEDVDMDESAVEDEDIDDGWAEDRTPKPKKNKRGGARPGAGRKPKSHHLRRQQRQAAVAAAVSVPPVEVIDDSPPPTPTPVPAAAAPEAAAAATPASLSLAEVLPTPARPPAPPIPAVVLELADHAAGLAGGGETEAGREVWLVVVRAAGYAAAGPRAPCAPCQASASTSTQAAPALVVPPSQLTQDQWHDYIRDEVRRLKRPELPQPQPQPQHDHAAAADDDTNNKEVAEDMQPADAVAQQLGDDDNFAGMKAELDGMKKHVLDARFGIEETWETMFAMKNDVVDLKERSEKQQREIADLRDQLKKVNNNSAAPRLRNNVSQTLQSLEINNNNARAQARAHTSFNLGLPEMQARLLDLEHLRIDDRNISDMGLARHDEMLKQARSELDELWMLVRRREDGPRTGAEIQDGGAAIEDAEGGGAEQGGGDKGDVMEVE